MSKFLTQFQRSFARRLSQLSARQEVDKFNLNIPIEKAVTPPSSWFTTQLFHELDKVFLITFVSLLAVVFLL